MFYVGQKVVCVRDGVSRFNGLPSNVRRGRVYTIAKVGSWFGHPTVELVETKPAQGADEFDATRFRPVVERQFDISIFTDMLTPKTAEVES